jgi:hypothetical protein
MAANRRVPMAAVRYINFHSDAVTLSRRGLAIRESVFARACARVLQPLRDRRDRTDARETGQGATGIANLTDSATDV